MDDPLALTDARRHPSADARRADNDEENLWNVDTIVDEPTTPIAKVGRRWSWVRLGVRVPLTEIAASLLRALQTGVHPVLMRLLRAKEAHPGLAILGGRLRHFVDDVAAWIDQPTAEENTTGLRRATLSLGVSLHLLDGAEIELQDDATRRPEDQRAHGSSVHRRGNVIA